MRKKNLKKEGGGEKRGEKGEGRRERKEGRREKEEGRREKVPPFHPHKGIKRIKVHNKKASYQYTTFSSALTKQFGF